MLQTRLDSPLLTMTRPTLGTGGFSRVRRTEMAAEGRWHCTSGEYRAGHNRDMTDTGNRARKTSGTQGKLDPIILLERTQIPLEAREGTKR